MVAAKINMKLKKLHRTCQRQSWNLDKLTPLASTPEQSRAARGVHTASTRDSHVDAANRQHPLVDIVTYSASRFPATVTDTEQMPKTVLIPAVALMA